MDAGGSFGGDQVRMIGEASPTAIPPLRRLGVSSPRPFACACFSQLLPVFSRTLPPNRSLSQGAASSKERVIRLPESTLFTRPVFRSGFEVLEDPAADERRCVASRDIEAGEAILIEHGLEAASRSALVLALSCDGALREHLWPRRGRGGSPGLQGEVPADIKASEARARHFISCHCFTLVLAPKHGSRTVSNEWLKEMSNECQPQASAVSAAVARLGYMEVMAAKENNCFIKDPEFATRAGAQAVCINPKVAVSTVCPFLRLITRFGPTPLLSSLPRNHTTGCEGQGGLPGVPAQDVPVPQYLQRLPPGPPQRLLHVCSDTVGRLRVR